MVKKIKNGYYVYAYPSKRILVEDGQGNKHWKTKTAMGGYIGTITEKDGNIPNENHLFRDIVTGRNYGDYAVALNYSSDTYNSLCSVSHLDDALHTLYTSLGTKNAKIRKFESMLIEWASKRIAIDGHVIACTSECNDFSEFGCKASKLGTEQIN